VNLFVKSYWTWLIAGFHYLHGQAVTFQKAQSPLNYRFFSDKDRSFIQKPLQIFRQCVGACVAVTRVATQAEQEDLIEVADNTAAQLGRCFRHTPRHYVAQWHFVTSPLHSK
jgi:hypothetical protein